jgi:hypothetical protein
MAVTQALAMVAIEVSKSIAASAVFTSAAGYFLC